MCYPGINGPPPKKTKKKHYLSSKLKNGGGCAEFSFSQTILSWLGPSPRRGNRTRGVAGTVNWVPRSIGSHTVNCLIGLCRVGVKGAGACRGPLDDAFGAVAVQAQPPVPVPEPPAPALADLGQHVTGLVHLGLGIDIIDVATGIAPVAPVIAPIVPGARARALGAAVLDAILRVTLGVAVEIAVGGTGGVGGRGLHADVAQQPIALDKIHPAPAPARHRRREHQFFGGDGGRVGGGGGGGPGGLRSAARA